MKTTRLLLVAVATLAAAYVAANFYIGHRLETETEILAQSLASRPDAQVSRLEYERDFRSGILHYDVTWRPESDDVRLARLLASGVAPADGIRFAGTLHFRHGPWVGGQAGFALAASQGGVALPEPWRPFLPAYPGEAPALEIAAVLTPGGDFEARLVAIDYHGPLESPDFDGDIRLDLAGLEGVLRANSRLDRLKLDAGLGKFGLRIEASEEQAGFAVQGLAVELDASEARPWLWTGTTLIAMDQLGIHTPQQQLELNDLKSLTETRIDAGRLQSTQEASIGTARLDEDGVLGGGLEISLHDVDADALSALVAEGHRQAEAAEPGDAEPGDTAWAKPYLEQILTGRPALAVDRLALSLVAPDDVRGRLEIDFTGQEPLSFDRPEALARALRVAAELRISKPALRHVAGVVSERQLPDGASEAERMAAADAYYQDTLAGLGLLPFVVVGDDDITAAVALHDGRVLAGEHEIMDVGAVLAVALAGMF
jgi:hypothetical protein